MSGRDIGASVGNCEAVPDGWVNELGKPHPGTGDVASPSSDKIRRAEASMILSFGCIILKLEHLKAVLDGDALISNVPDQHHGCDEIRRFSYCVK